MKSKLRILLLIGFIISNNLLLKAQDKPDSKKIKLKLYVNAFYQHIKNNDYHGFLGENETCTFENKNYDIGFLSFALEFGSYKRYKHEIEIMPFKFDQSTTSNFITRINGTGPLGYYYEEHKLSFKSAYRYQANYYIIQNKYLIPYIGLSSQLFYESIREGTTSYYMEKDLGLLFAIVPSIIFNINERISIDLNVPIDLYKIEIHYVEKRDYPLRDKTSRVYKEFTPETINIRFGICYKL